MEEDDPYNPKLTYLSDYPKLPIDAPVGHPHLVDPGSVSEEFPQAELTIADLVVTVLFKYMPEALTAFLDLDRPEVHYIQGGGSTRLDFCIKRDKRVVTVSLDITLIVGNYNVTKRRLDFLMRRKSEAGTYYFNTTSRAMRQELGRLSDMAPGLGTT